MLLVSDVHGSFDALARLSAYGETVLVLGDLVNLIDYRTIEGIVPDVVGVDLVADIVRLRGADRGEDAARLWRTRTEALDIDVRAEIARLMEHEYRRMRVAMADLDALVIHGNVDDPAMLRAHLPPRAHWVDQTVRDIDGVRFGFVGGGTKRIGSSGEVDDDTMRARLEALGPVDVLCTHIPPAVGMLAEDVIGGPAKGSEPVLEYLLDMRPARHFFGDVHQPRATRLVVGDTVCRNVGYFRATGRPLRHRPGVASPAP